MRRNAWLLGVVSALAIAVSLTRSAPADENVDDFPPMIVDLLKTPDREMRSLALQQVREGLEGEAVTKRMVELLPTLSTEAQADLLVALGERADKAARPAMVDALDSTDAAVRIAAIRAAATLGEAADVPRLVGALTASEEAEQAAAYSSLERLVAEGVDEAIVAELDRASPERRGKLIDLAVARGARAAVPTLLAIAEQSDAADRGQALEALRELAGPRHVPRLVRLLLKEKDRGVRDEIEKAVMFASRRVEEIDGHAAPLLAEMALAGEEEKLALLGTLGRVGGASARRAVEVAIADPDPRRHDAGVRALCNWPDASVAPQLLKLAKTTSDRGERINAVRALMRISVLPDDRTDAQRLDLLKQALSLATREQEYELALDRAKAVRTIESLRFVVPYLDDPKHAQTACETVVALAHYRDLRTPNKAEFDQALDQVIAICKAPEVVKRAEMYKKGQTL